MTFFFAGTVLVWPSAAITPLMEHRGRFKLSADDFRWITLCPYFGQCFSPIIAGHIVDVVGRKYTLASTFFLFSFCWIITGIARSPWQLYVARIFGGMGVGSACTVTPMYVGEIAEDNIRGSLVSVFQVMFIFGMGSEYLLGMCVSNDILWIILCSFPILFIISFIWMPESPYYLMMRAREREAERSLMILRGIKNADYVKREIEMIQSLTTTQPKYMRQVSTLCSDKAVRKTIIIVLAAVLFKDLSGILSIWSFVTVVFQLPGMYITELTSGVIVATMQLIMSICASLLIDRVGRKMLFIVSCIVSCIALIAAGIYFFLSEDATSLKWFPVLFICIFLLAFPLGLGSVPLTLASEMFAMHIKGTALSVTAIFSAGTSLFSVYMFSLCSHYQGDYLGLCVCAIFCALGAGFMLCFLTETAGRPVLEILQHYRRDSEDEGARG